MSELNIDLGDFHARHAPDNVLENGASISRPLFPWLTLFLAADIIVVFAVIWYFNAPH